MLFHVRDDDHRDYMIEADSFEKCIELWREFVKEEWGSDYEDTDQPASVHLIHDDPVIRIMSS